MPTKGGTPITNPLQRQDTVPDFTGQGIPGIDQQSNSTLTSQDDPRARLLLKPSDKQLLQSKIFSPILETNGIIFPYTPFVNHGASSTYEPIELTHSNFKYNAWKNSYPNDISISEAIFTSQTVKEAEYTLSVINFLRFLTKGRTGQSSFVGATPPVLHFSYLGPLMFNNVPVLVSDFNFSIDNAASIVPVVMDGITSYVPSRLIMTITLKLQYNTKDTREFSIDKFISGEYMKSKKGYI